MLRAVLSVAVGVIGVVWLLMVVVGADSFPSEPVRRRRLRASFSFVVFVCFGLIQWDRFGEVASGAWWVSLVGVLCGLLGSLLSFGKPRDVQRSSRGA
jgi:drug/metabolite transporter (DMT)-like permease